MFCKLDIDYCFSLVLQIIRDVMRPPDRGFSFNGGSMCNLFTETTLVLCVIVISSLKQPAADELTKTDVVNLVLPGQV